MRVQKLTLAILLKICFNKYSARSYVWMLVLIIYKNIYIIYRYIYVYVYVHSFVYMYMCICISTERKNEIILT